MSVADAEMPRCLGHSLHRRCHLRAPQQAMEYRLRVFSRCLWQCWVHRFLDFLQMARNIAIVAVVATATAAVVVTAVAVAVATEVIVIIGVVARIGVCRPIILPAECARSRMHLQPLPHQRVRRRVGVERGSKADAAAEKN